MSDELESRPAPGSDRRTRIALRIAFWLVLVGLVGFRVYSHRQEWKHHEEKGYDVGADFREHLLESRIDAAWDATTARFKERWSRKDLEEIAARASADDTTRRYGFSIHSGFWSNFFRGHMRTVYPIGLDEHREELRVTIVEDDGVLRVDDMEVFQVTEEE